MSEPLLEVRALSKSYGPVKVLSDVDLTVDAGEVVGLIGENGAGKSTLLNILSGTTGADAGSVRVAGRPFAPDGYHEATVRGVFRVFQELALVGSLPVYENLFLSHERRFGGRGLHPARRMRERAAALVERYGHGWIDVTRPTSSYDFATRQILEIIKAVGLAELLEIETPVILLDEPTTALSLEETEFFAALVRRLRTHAGIVFISHRLEELIELSDRLVVLKDGVVVGESPAATASPGSIHSLMVGRERDEEFYREPEQLGACGDAQLEVRAFREEGAFHDVDLTIRAGEVVGLGGVLGSGKSEFGRALFGAADGKVTGELRIAGTRIDRPTVRRMLRAGMGYVTPERGEEGLLESLPVAWNISLPRQGPGDVDRTPLRPSAETERARELIDRLGIRTRGPREPVGNLSGGNQQKVMLARWLSRPTRVLVLDNPTRGVDAGAKEEIYGLLRELARQGVAILLITDDLLELIGLADRILVMKDGSVVHECLSEPGHKPAEDTLVSHMV